MASALLIVTIGSVGCVGHDAEAKRPAGYVVDSIFAPAEALRRFRVGLDSPAKLDGPVRRDELVAQFFAALRSKDRAALQRLVMNRAEFAYLVFPETKWSREPYRQPPQVAWLLFGAQNDAAISRLLARAARYDLMSYRCNESELDGRLSLWTRCVVRVRESGRMRDARLFGTIIERDGRFKFAGYASDF